MAQSQSKPQNSKTEGKVLPSGSSFTVNPTMSFEERNKYVVDENNQLHVGGAYLCRFMNKEDIEAKTRMRDRRRKWHQQEHEKEAATLLCLQQDFLRIITERSGEFGRSTKGSYL